MASRTPSGTWEISQRALGTVATLAGLIGIVVAVVTSIVTTRLAVAQKVDRSEYIEARAIDNSRLAAIELGVRQLSAKADSVNDGLRLIRCELLKSRSPLIGCGR